MIYDGEECNIEGSWIDCKDKKVRVHIPALQTFFKGRKKIICGHRTDTGELCYIWQDSSFVHIGCLKETRDSFQRKYILLIKQINNAKHTKEQRREEREIQ